MWRLSGELAVNCSTLVDLPRSPVDVAMQFVIAFIKPMLCYVMLCSGLLSGHLMATRLRKSHGVMSWYTGELLHMAHDIGNRLLPAFNTTTGMPFPRVCVECLHVIVTVPTADPGNFLKVLKFFPFSRAWKMLKINVASGKLWKFDVTVLGSS